MRVTTAVDVRQHLRNLGMIGDASCGVQIDIAAAFREFQGHLQQNSLCDHNCTSDEGCYDCPAAFGLDENRGLKRNSMAPAEVMLERINVAAMGAKHGVSRFLEANYPGFCHTSEIHDGVVRGVIESELVRGKPIINIFGGEPTLYLHFVQLLGALMDRGYTLNLTTTGRPWLLHPDFVTKIQGIEPQVLALSLDDLSVQALRRLIRLPSHQIREIWKRRMKKNPKHGQGLKAIEAVYILRYYQEHGGYPGRILLNMVLHQGNLGHVQEMFDVVEKVAPEAMLNPYADQTAFNHDKLTGKRMHGAFGPREIEQFSDFVDWSISQSHRSDARIAKRAQHWFLHRAALDLHNGDTRKMADAIAGWNSWRCYNNVGASFFVQVGRAPRTHLIPLSTLKTGPVQYPGGHLGCFWDPSAVTQTTQYHTIQDVVDYMHFKMRSTAATNPDPCPGCRMPRLDSLHLVILEAGIPDDQPDLKNQYLRTRRREVGF